MGIIYKELLPKDGLRWVALFEVNGAEVKVGITDTMVAIWNIQKTEKIIALFLRQFGTLMIQLMLAQGKLKDYIFISHDFTDINGDIISKDKLQEYLEDKVLKAEEEKKQIGFHVR